MDRISRAQRSENMRRIKSGGMKPEIAVRRLIHSLGYRYRLHRHDLPGRPDIVLGPRRKIVFIHGCFWHSHSKKGCPRTRVPKSNLSYWIPKLTRTRARDEQNTVELRKLGWRVFVVWECETANLNRLRQRLQAFLTGK